MTIVIQHWFDGLNVKEDGFDITLNFGDQPESLVVPFLAILTFVDPSVEFGLRFEQNEDDEQPKFSGLIEAMNSPSSDLRIFGKPTSRPFRRMAVTLTYGEQDVKDLVKRAKELASKIKVS